LLPDNGVANKKLSQMLCCHYFYPVSKVCIPFSFSFPDVNPLSKKYLPDYCVTNKELSGLLCRHSYCQVGIAIKLVPSSFPDFNPLSQKSLPDYCIANKELPRLLGCHSFKDFGNQDWHSVFAAPLDGNPETLKQKTNIISWVTLG
jgi:hypothetical protein